jgi:integrase
MSIWDDDKGRKHVGVMVGGKRVHRILPQGTSAGDAKLIEAELRSAIVKNPKRVVIPGDPSMSLVLAVYIQHAQTLRGTAHAEQAAKRMGAWAEKYKASQAREFAAHFIKDTLAAYAPATINRSLACAKKGLSLCWEKNITPENYGLRIKTLDVNNKREVFLSVDQVQKITQHCTEQAQAAVWAALLTGARRGELFKIKAEHIHEDTITVPASHTKTLRSRVIPIIPALRPWLKYFPLTMTIDGIKSAWRRARVKANMEHVNFHDLRHSCASIMLGLGVDLYTIGKILGHSNTQTTQRYAHLQIEQQRAALDKLSVLVIENKLHQQITQA